jgi:hypothetical protein
MLRRAQTHPMFTFASNSKKQGDIGMGVAIGWYTSNGFTVCIPLTDSQNYDLVVDSQLGQLRRIQVRTTSNVRPSGGYEATLLVSGGNRSGEGKKKSCVDMFDIDDFFFVCGNGDIYIIPRAELLQNKRGIVLGLKYERFRIHMGAVPRGAL